MMLPFEFGGILSFDRDKTRLHFETLLSNQGVSNIDVFSKATKMMEETLLEEMKKSIKQNKHFVLETPLSHPDYWRYIDLFQDNGYQIQLNYLCLDKISDCIARVGQRVMEGGHYVKPDTIKGVYEKNLEHINNNKNDFKVIELYDGMIVPTLIARLEDGVVNFSTKDAFKKKWITTGLPNLAILINEYKLQN